MSRVEYVVAQSAMLDSVKSTRKNIIYEEGEGKKSISICKCAHKPFLS